MKQVKAGAITYFIEKENKHGYAIGKTHTGDLFIGYYKNPSLDAVEYYKNTPENYQLILSQYDLYKSFL